MKPSHLKTPRTLADTQFDTGYAQTLQTFDRADAMVMYWGSMIGAFVLGLLAGGAI